jgi:hypothetical protein
MKGMAMDGRAEPIVELTTRKAVMTRTKVFLRYILINSDECLVVFAFGKW